MLLHSCCAPCSGAVLECLLANGIKPVVFFSNSNITPYSEYELRRAELARYCDSLGVTMVDDEYDHDAWLDFVLNPEGNNSGGVGGYAPRPLGVQGDGSPRGHELALAPERGPRCLNCFKFRLKRAAEYAATHGIPVLTTTLASSRWKSLEQVAEAGAMVCGGIAGQAGYDVRFWPQNWRKGGLQPRRAEIIREQNFYNQTWCGCEFSHRDATPETGSEQ